MGISGPLSSSFFPTSHFLLASLSCAENLFVRRMNIQQDLFAGAVVLTPVASY
jgi:hypothetical protein